MYKRLLCVALAGGLAWGSLGGADLPPDPTLEPPNLFPHKLQLRAYIDSGGYAKGVAKVALDAAKYVQKRAPRGAKGKKMAIVFDIDETTLTNLPHIIGNDYAYIPKLWEEWIAAGRCPAIVPVQAVYDAAVRLKIDVFFITGRREEERAATEHNLRDVGYDTWTKIYFKPTSDITLSVTGFKTDTRRKLEQEGYVIIANIGDQNSDLVGGYAEKIFKLPNPFYISK
jgi:predicted secreted acid phosphatase